MVGQGTGCICICIVNLGKYTHMQTGTYDKNDVDDEEIFIMQ